MSAPETVSYKSHGHKIAAHLYRPVEGSPDRKGAGIVIAHPWTSIKEQSPANYAKRLSAAGFTCLTYDSAFYGESEGEPRDLEDPGERQENIKSGVTFLATVKGVDPERIGILGICASGGYVCTVAQSDLRVKAVATASAVCVGTMAREGYDKGTANADTLRAQLENAAKVRNQEAQGAHIDNVHMLPDKPEQAPPDMPESFRDLMDYYRTPRGYHERATNQAHPQSWDAMAVYDAFHFNHMIAPRPLLMCAGSKAATFWHSEKGIANAKEPKELFTVPDRTHADLYDRIDGVVPKLEEFYGKHLVS